MDYAGGADADGVDALLDWLNAGGDALNDDRVLAEGAAANEEHGGNAWAHAAVGGCACPALLRPAPFPPSPYARTHARRSLRPPHAAATCPG